MNVTVPVYQAKTGGWIQWTTLGLGEETVSQGGRSAVKIQQHVTDKLKAAVRKMEPGDLTCLQMSRGIRLERLRLELTIKRSQGKRKVAGRFPVIVEPLWFDADTRVEIAYHPDRQKEWFPITAGEALVDQAALFFQHAWKDLDDEDLDDLRTEGRDSLAAISFTARPKTLLDKLPDAKKGIWDHLEAQSVRGKKKRKSGGMKVLPDIATDETPRAVEGAFSDATPRSPTREELQQLICTRKKRSVIVVGPPGVGKTTAIGRLIADLLESDDFASHRNLDKVHHVWTVSGRRIIAGMSYLGDWEKRCSELLDDVVGRKIVLLAEDLHAWGRVGRTRESSRNLGEFFRGPVARGDVTLIGECTPEQVQRLEEDAPSFAAQFTLVRMQPTTAAETLQLMIQAARPLEARHHTRFHPQVFRVVLELGGALSAGSEFPGKALEQIRQLAKRKEGNKKSPGDVTAADVVALLSERTGLPALLLKPSESLDPQDVADDLQRYVMGQRDAIRSTVSLVMRIRSGLTSPARPYGVFLFTGPTGTGKTELSKCIAEYLYGDIRRLIRLDMSEYSSADAAARLIGDRYEPEGILTQAVLEQPFSVVLLDEIEKAHPSVLNLMLQLFDDGRLTDAAGNTAHFAHTVVIMTSNLGAKERATVGFGEDAAGARRDIARAVREFFAPELFNRIDEVVPFGPLTPEAATRIADKELRSMLGRRGLKDRNIVVHAGRRVLERVVRLGFDPVYGARTVKKYLEGSVGELLSNQIASGPRASMQIFHLFEHGDELRLHVEPLTETSPRDEPLAIAELVDFPVNDLRDQLPAALDQLDELLADERITALAEQMSRHVATLADPTGDAGANEAEAAFHLDSLRSALAGLRGKAGYLFSTVSYDRNAILEALAEINFMRRAVAHVEDPSWHAVFIEVLKVGRADDAVRFRGSSAGLLESLCIAYAGDRGDVESVAASSGGLVQVVSDVDSLPRGRPDMVVLRVVGLNVRDYYQGEHGMHIWDSMIAGNSMVRVRVFPADLEETPVGVIEDHIAALGAFEEALEGGTELPPNPRALLPAVRRITFDPPDRDGDLAKIEVEDYLLGHVEETRARRIQDVLPRLWRLRMSRGGDS